MSDSYACAQCGGTFPREWSDEEALAEARDNGFNPDTEDMVSVRRLLPQDGGVVASEAVHREGTVELMSAHLGWEPAEPQPLGGRLGSMMKQLLAERYANGSETALTDDGVELDESDIDFLEGVKAAGAGDLADDAAGLIAGIRQYKCVRIVHC